MQVYIITGGKTSNDRFLTSTETLQKDGGISWQSVADLPTSRGRAYLRGVGLPEGRFIVTGEEEFLNVFIISDIQGYF